MISKKFNHKKIKPRPKKQPEFLSWLHNSKQPCCFVCNTFLGIDMHHIKETSTDYRNDEEIIPLCKEHHTGSELSPHGTAREFRSIYPLEEQRKAALKLYEEYLNTRI